MISSTFFDHPIANLITRLASSPEAVPSGDVIMASVRALQAEMRALSDVLALETADLGHVFEPLLRTYFAAVVLASQVARVPAEDAAASERFSAFADQAEGVMTALAPRVGPCARGIASRVLGASGTAAAGGRAPPVLALA